MTKGKRLVSLFLAALLLMSCFGAISASALTNEEAAAKLAAYEDIRPDLSDVYSKINERQSASTLKAIDTTLAAVLEKKDVRSTLYTDATVAKLTKLLYSALSGVAGGMISQTPRELSKVLRADYSEAADYLKTFKIKDGWDKVDESKLVFEIEPGNAAQFKAAVCTVLAPVGQFLFVFEPVVSAVLEVLHTGTAVSVQKAIEESDYDASNETQKVANEIYLAPIFDAIELFFAHPVDYLCEILPDLAYTYDNVVVPGMAEGFISIQLPSLESLLSSILSSVKDSTRIQLPAIDVNRLAHMGTAAVADSIAPLTKDSLALYEAYEPGYRVVITADKPMVFAALMGYVGKTLRSTDNQVAIGMLVLGATGEEYQASYDAIVAAAKSGNPLDIASACLDFTQEYAGALGAAETTNPVLAFFAKVTAALARIGKRILSIFKIA